MESDRASHWLMIASNIGVLVGLIFVGLEVRNSSYSVIAQSANSITSGYNEFNYVVAADPELSRIVYLGIRDPDRLTGPETYRAALMITGLFNQFRELHTLYADGVISEVQWERAASEIDRLMRFDGVKTYLANNPTLFDQSFFDDVTRSSKLNMVGSTDEGARTLGRGRIQFE